MPVLLVAALVIAGLVAWLSWKADQKRKATLGGWASSNGWSFDTAKTTAIEGRYPPFSCFREGDRRYAFNVMQGEHDGRPVCAFDYHYQTYSTDSKGNRQTHHHRFSSVVVDSRLPLSPLLIRPENLLDKMAGFLGWDDIDFEHAAFSREFYVKSPDRRWAFDVLHQKTIEYLLASPRFTVEMAGTWVLARRSGRFDVGDFAAAVALVDGILDRLPRYVLQDLGAETRDRKGGAT